MRSLNDGNYSSKIKFEDGNFYKMNLVCQVSRLALRSPVGAAMACGSGLFFAPAAYAACDINAVAGTVQCTADTVTTDTTYPTGGGNARHVSGAYSTPITVTVAQDVDVTGMGLAVTNTGTGGVVVRHDGVINVETVRGPKTGVPGTMLTETTADDVSGVLAIEANGGDILLTGSGDIYGRQTDGRGGEPLDGLVVRNNGTGKLDINMSGNFEARGYDVAIFQSAVNVNNGLNGGDVNVVLGDADLSSTIRGNVLISNQSQDASLKVTVNSENLWSYSVNVGASSADVAELTVNGKGVRDTWFNVANYGSGSAVVRMNDDSIGHISARTEGGDIRVSTRSVQYGPPPGFISKAIELQQVNGSASGNIDLDIDGIVSGVYAVDILNMGTGRTTVRQQGEIIGQSSVQAALLIAGRGGADVISNGDISGLNSAAYIFSLDQDISFTGTGRYHSDNEYALQLQTLGSGNITTDISGTLSSNQKGGLWARDQSGGFATGPGGTMKIVTGDVKATADAGIGIDLLAELENAEILLTSNGKVTAGAKGIMAKITSVGGSRDVNVTTNGDVTAAAAIELGNASTGKIVMTQAAGTQILSTDSHGISTMAAAGHTQINVAGTVLATGANASGVMGQSTTGNITVNVAKTGMIDPDYGINLSTVDGALLVNNSGVVEGDLAAIRLTATGTGTAAITNDGTITGPQNSVQATPNSGNFTFTNSGTFNGAVNVSGSNVAASTLTNSAAGVANFGSLASSVSGNFANAGTANLGVGGDVLFLGSTTNSGRIQLAGNSQFQTNGAMANIGMIHAANGVVTDNIIVGGSYAGGGQLAVDYNIGAMTADQMTIAGDATATTNVVLNRVGPATFLTGGFLPVVTVVGSADANAFTGMGTTIGLVQERFGQNPADAHQFGVMQNVNPNAGTLAGMSLIAEAASAALDEPMRPYITGRTDADGGRGHLGLWMRLGGGRTDQSVTTTISGGPLALASREDVRTKFWSAQLGLDYAMVNMGGGWDLHLGVMGGWYSGNSHFGNGNLLKVEAPFAGVYAVVDYGGLSIEASVRHEWRRYTALLPGLLGDAPRDFDGSATAASLYASYRLGGDTGFSATPFVGFQYASADMDDIDIDAQTRFVTDKDKSKVGRAGIRVGYRFGDPASVTIEPFGGISYLRNWSRGVNNIYQWDAPATTFAARAETWRETIRYSAGLDIRAHHSRVTGFVAANLDDGGRRDGKSVQAGLRLNF